MRKVTLNIELTEEEFLKFVALKARSKNPTNDTVGFFRLLLATYATLAEQKQKGYSIVALDDENNVQAVLDV